MYQYIIPGIVIRQSTGVDSKVIPFSMEFMVKGEVMPCRRSEDEKMQEKGIEVFNQLMKDYSIEAIVSGIGVDNPADEGTSYGELQKKRNAELRELMNGAKPQIRIIVEYVKDLDKQAS